MNGYLFLILALLIGGYLLETAADLLNLGALRQIPPPELRDLYDPEKYRKTQAYQTEKTRLSLAQSTLFLVLLAAFILLGGFESADRFARGFGSGPVLTGLIFVGALSAIRLAFQLPFTIYDTFGIEGRYGFNRTSVRTFVLDIVRGTLIGGSIGGGVFAGIVALFERLGPGAWVYGWVGLSLFQILLLFAAPILILPLFNRFDPVPPGELRTSIEEYARSQDFELSGVFTMDGSRRSSKANAFFTGFGRYRRLVLFDTLVAKQSREELLAVLAHEVGHYKRRHIPKFLALSVLSTGLLFWLLSLLIGNRQLFDAFRIEHTSVYASLVLIGFLYGPIGRFLSLLTQWMSRRFEFEADRYSAETFGQPEQLVSALKKLASDHLSHLTPHPLKVILDHTHPPLNERIAALRKGSS